MQSTTVAAFCLGGTALGSVAGAQSPHYAIQGASPGDQLGWSIASTPDVDGDGARELIVSGAARLVLVSGASGVERWSQTPDWPLGSPEARRVSGIDDIDGDGAGDVLVADADATTMSLSRGIVRAYSGSTGALIHEFQTTPPLRHIGESLADLGDVDGDGRADFVVAGRDALNVGHARVYSGIDAHVIHEVTTGGSAQTAVANAGDVDADGIDDFIASSASAGSLWVFSGATAAPLHHIGLPGGYTGLASAGDVDADGHADFAVANQLMPSQPMRVYSGATGTELLSSYPATDGIADLGDVDGDGRHEIALFGRGGGALPPCGIAVSTAGGAILARLHGRHELDYAGFAPRFPMCGLGDVDGDGSSEVAVAQPSYGVGEHGDALGKVWVYTSIARTSVGAGFGFGDGSGAPCPCGNPAPNAGSGCANSTGQGAVLAAHGSTSVLADDFALDVTGVRRDVLCSIAFSSATAPGPGPIVGDGRRVLGGAVQRILTGFTAFDGFATSGFELGWRQLWAPGSTVYFQAAYRDGSGPCGGGINLTNGVALTFTP